MMPSSSNQRAAAGTSRTRSSPKNSRRYRRTSGTDVESGEPRLTRRTARLGMRGDWSEDRGQSQTRLWARELTGVFEFDECHVPGFLRTELRKGLASGR